MSYRLEWRPISGGFFVDLWRGPRNPQWVRDLKGKSGVYFIRDSGSKALLYVGESHTGRLFDTLTRHFRSWSGKTAGPTYLRSAVEVAVRVAQSGRVLAMQDAGICRLRPKDNKKLNCGKSDDPF